MRGGFEWLVSTRSSQPRKEASGQKLNVYTLEVLSLNHASYIGGRNGVCRTRLSALHAMAA